MSIDKYLEQVDLIDYYITKNICKLIKDKNENKFIKSNLFLLSYNNKNKKNSLKLLLENNDYNIIKELIDYNSVILDYKTGTETNLLMMIIMIQKVV